MSARQDFPYPVKELENKISQYFQECDEAGKYYSEAGLCYAIGIPLSRYRYLMEIAYNYTRVTQGINKYKQDIKDESIQWGHLEVLAREVLRIAEQLAQRTDKMALAQVRNASLGGYEERPAQARQQPDGPLKIEVELKGGKRGVDPFG